MQTKAGGKISYGYTRMAQFLQRASVNKYKTSVSFTKKHLQSMHTGGYKMAIKCKYDWEISAENRNKYTADPPKYPI